MCPYKLLPPFSCQTKASSPLYRKKAMAQAQQLYFLIPCVLPLRNYTPPAYAMDNFTPSLSVNTLPYFSCKIYKKSKSVIPFRSTFIRKPSLSVAFRYSNPHKIRPHPSFPYIHSAGKPQSHHPPVPQDFHAYQRSVAHIHHPAVV